jgi:predicted O-methyltransferase YrrM
MDQQPVSPSNIETLANAVYPSFVMLAAMELDLFTALRAGPLTASQVAEIANIDPKRTAPLLHALVAVGLLNAQGERFSNTNEADRFLVRDRPDYIGMRHHAYRRRWASMFQVSETMRTGESQGRMRYADMPIDARESFYRGTFTEALAAGRELALRQDFSRHARLIDIGGGSGGLAIGLAQAWPQLDITITDLPANVALAQRYVTEAGLSHRVTVAALDIVENTIPDTYDIAVMRGVVPVLTPDQLKRALANIYRAMKSGGSLYVMGWILDDARTSPVLYATYNLLFLNDYDDAQLYTEQEHRTWLSEAGFRAIERERSAGAYAADYIVARKP